MRPATIKTGAASSSGTMTVVKRCTHLDTFKSNPSNLDTLKYIYSVFVRCYSQDYVIQKVTILLHSSTSGFTNHHADYVSLTGTSIMFHVSISPPTLLMSGMYIFWMLWFGTHSRTLQVQEA